MTVRECLVLPFFLRVRSGTVKLEASYIVRDWTPVAPKRRLPQLNNTFCWEISRIAASLFGGGTLQSE